MRGLYKKTEGRKEKKEGKSSTITRKPDERKRREACIAITA